MNIEVENNTFKCPIQITTDSDQHTVLPNTICSFYVENDSYITITPQIKSRVKLPILGVIMDYNLPDDIRTFIVCCHRFKIRSNTGYGKIIITDNKAHKDKETVFCSTFAHASNCFIDSSHYIIINKAKLIKKHSRIVFWLLSSFPLLLLGFLELILNQNFEIFGALGFIFLVCFIPSLKRIQKFKNICSDETANVYLNSPIEFRNKIDVSEEIINNIIDNKKSKSSNILIRLIKRWINFI